MTWPGAQKKLGGGSSISPADFLVGQPQGVTVLRLLVNNSEHKKEGGGKKGPRKSLAKLTKQENFKSN